MTKNLAALLAGAVTAVAAVAAPPATAPAPAPEKLLYAEGGMLVLVAPAFPREALAQGLTARIDVSGTVRTDGGLDNASIDTGAGNEAFAAAVKTVVPLWRLQPRIDPSSCLATEGKARVSLWFDIANGQPKVSYGTARPEGAKAPDIRTDRKPDRMVAPLYPQKLAMDPNAPRAILQVAYVAVAEDGSVTGVTVAPMLHYREFEPLLAAAIRQWKYAPQQTRWCAEVRFHMTLD